MAISAVSNTAKDPAHRKRLRLFLSSTSDIRLLDLDSAWRLELLLPEVDHAKDRHVSLTKTSRPKCNPIVPAILMLLRDDWKLE